MLKVKKGFILRKLGTEYMAVAIGEASRNFNGMIRLNGTGAFYWKELEKGTTKEDLVSQTLEKYEGVTEETALHDVEEFLDTISVAVEDVR
ncbi:MAG: PqqD family protein [Blautia sp.]